MQQAVDRAHVEESATPKFWWRSDVVSPANVKRGLPETLKSTEMEEVTLIAGNDWLAAMAVSGVHVETE